MSEMIDRVALAICGDDNPANILAIHRTRARAAIEAMRTPTDEMVSLGVGAVKLAKNISHGADPSAVLKGRTVLAWQVMINAALSEKP